MGVVYQKSKQTGITYAYESVSHWDKVKKQSRATRKCIGKIEPGTGKIVPTRKSKAKQAAEADSRPAPKGPVPANDIRHSYYGATYLFDEIGKNLGITDDLKRCFPKSYKKILSVAYYLVLEDKNPLYRFPKWSKTHKHPYGRDITSQRSSELFESITEQGREDFFRLQGKRRSENEYWAYDISTFSTWSECLKQAKYGHNKEDDRIEQINIALLFGEQSGLPFYYRKLPGNIPDVKAVMNLLADMDFFEYKKIKLVMDRGFYSEDNINGLFKNHLKFIISTRTSLKYVRQAIDKSRDTILYFENYDADLEVYISTSTIAWNYSQGRPYKGDTIEGERRAYLHIYYNRERAVSEEVEFNKLLISLVRELESGNAVPEHEKQYQKYFDVAETPKRGIKVNPKNDAIREVMKYYGYFALLTNEIKDPAEALKVYRNKDLVEKAFGNLKERLNFRRMEVSSELCLDGKMFTEFIALIYLSYMQKTMHDKGLFKDYTLQGVLDELDVIDCYEQPGCALRFGEFTKRQQELYSVFGMRCPASL